MQEALVETLRVVDTLWVSVAQETLRVIPPEPTIVNVPVAEPVIVEVPTPKAPWWEILIKFTPLITTAAALLIGWYAFRRWQEDNRPFAKFKIGHNPPDENDHKGRITISAEGLLSKPIHLETVRLKLGKTTLASTEAIRFLGNGQDATIGYFDAVEVYDAIKQDFGLIKEGENAVFDSNRLELTLAVEIQASLLRKFGDRLNLRLPQNNPLTVEYIKHKERIGKEG